MSIATLSVSSLSAMQSPDTARLTSAFVKQFVEKNPRAIDPSSDFAAEMAKATPALAEQFWTVFLGQKEDTQPLSLLVILTKLEAMHDKIDSLSELGELEAL